MHGQHRSPRVLGPGFISQPMRHVNRNRSADRTGELGSTLLLLPDDTDATEREGRYIGRHRTQARQRA